MTESIRKRLSALEARQELTGAFCLVSLPDGSTQEVSVAEWLEHRQEWTWERMTKGNVAPVYFMLLHLTESIIDQTISDGASPEDPDIQQLREERNLYIRHIEQKGGTF